jgi:hypothetical protein
MKCTGSDLSTMELREENLSDFLKHLFFFHRLYALFGDAAKCHDFISYSQYQVSTA